MSNAEDYPYLFQTSGFPRVDSIRAEIESQKHWDFSGNVSEADRNMQQAALRYGLKAPFSPEQTALANVLTKKKAGLNICTYAWGLYVEDLQKSCTMGSETQLTA